MLNHQKVPLNILKFNVEENEWLILADMLETKALKNVEQLSFEVGFFFYLKTYFLLFFFRCDLIKKLFGVFTMSLKM